jgi:hypothetical protein
MSYRVNLDGSIDCGTAQEAMNLQSLIRNQIAAQRNGNGVAVLPGARNDSGHPSVTVAVLSDLARMFLSELLAHPNQTAHDVARKIDSKPSSLPPMYRGLRKWASDIGLNYDELFVRAAGRTLSISERARNIVEFAVRE